VAKLRQTVGLVYTAKAGGKPLTTRDLLMWLGRLCRVDLRFGETAVSQLLSSLVAYGRRCTLELKQLGAASSVPAGQSDNVGIHSAQRCANQTVRKVDRLLVRTRYESSNAARVVVRRRHSSRGSSDKHHRLEHLRAEL